MVSRLSDYSLVKAIEMQTIIQPYLLAVSKSLPWVVALGTALVLSIEPSRAEPVTYDYFVTVTQGPFAGNAFSGSFSFDDSVLTGVGQETIGVKDGLTVSSSFFDFDYRETDDTRYPDYPKLIFENGVITRLDFWVEDGERVVWWDLPGWNVDLSRRPSASTAEVVPAP
jgi:hypothetical protein